MSSAAAATLTCVGTNSRGCQNKRPGGGGKGKGLLSRGKQPLGSSRHVLQYHCKGTKRRIRIKLATTYYVQYMHRRIVIKRYCYYYMLRLSAVGILYETSFIASANTQHLLPCVRNNATAIL